MTDNDELPIGFTMELAMHADAMKYFSNLSPDDQEMIVNQVRNIQSHDAMKSFVEHMSPDTLQVTVH